MTEDRTKREQETREKTVRAVTTFRPPSLLPEPEKQDGYKYRWVRTRTLNVPDMLNVSTRRREGWEPVKRSEHPELADLIPDEGSRYKDNIEIGGLLLCKASNERVAARNEYYQQLAARQIEGVDNNYMRENDPRMPLLKPARTSRTTFGKSTE